MSMSEDQDTRELVARILSDERGKRCLDAALKRKAEGSMLPIGQYITSELLEGMSDELVGWMIDLVRTSDVRETTVVFKAIAETDRFKDILDAGISAMSGRPDVYSQEQGMRMMIALALIIGWKLAERRMSELAEGVAG